ncbi:MAG: phosphatase PAP2 family protein, partial [Pseudomonadota bacterium]
MTQREGIVGLSALSAEQLPPKKAFETAGNAGWRLLRLDANWRAQVVAQELSEGLTVATAKDGAACTVHVNGKPLATLERPDPQALREGLAVILGYADLRLDRAAEIVAQRGDVISFISASLPLDAVRTPRTIELLLAAQRMTEGVLQAMKVRLGVPRPSLMHPAVQPMIATPTHDAYPSGHATQSFMCAQVLRVLMGRARHEHVGQGDDSATDRATRDYIDRTAARVTQNRTVAGLHYPADNASGAVLGRQMALHFLARLRASLDGDPDLAAVPDAKVRTFGSEAWVAEGPGKAKADDEDPHSIPAKDFAAGTMDGMGGAPGLWAALEAGEVPDSKPAPLT